MDNDLATVLARVRSHPTCSIHDAAFCLGISANRAYQTVREGRELAPGVQPFRVGAKNLRCASRPLLRLIGELEDPDPESKE